MGGGTQGFLNMPEDAWRWFVAEVPVGGVDVNAVLPIALHNISVLCFACVVSVRWPRRRRHPIPLWVGCGWATGLAPCLELVGLAGLTRGRDWRGDGIE